MKKILVLGGLLMALFGAGQAQWGGSSATLVQVSESHTGGHQVLADEAGHIYAYYLIPDSSRIVPYVKKFNYDGTEAWDAPVRLSAYPTKTYTMINNYITLDKNDNLVAVVWDARLDEVDKKYTATAYKLSPEGKMLWGEEGVKLTDGNGLALGACMNLTTLDDNSTVFAWNGQTDLSTQDLTIYMQRVTADGKAQWTGKTLASGGQSVSYPYMVNAGHNEYFMFYCQGATPELYVQKFDFDGNAVWAQPTLVYGMGGFGNGGVMQTIVSVAEAKDGMLIGWNDDRDNTDFESVYLAYINRDGKHVFSAADAGLKLGYSGLRGFQPKMVYNKASDEIYAIWIETNGGQSYRQVRAQRVSATGELLWDNEGIELCPLAERQAGQQSVQVGLKGGAIFFYMTQQANGDYGHTSAFAALYGQDGKPAWEREQVALTDGQYAESSLASVPLRKNQWVVSLKDNRNYDDMVSSDLFIQNILIDGTLGDDAHLNEGGGETANEGGLEAAAFGVYPNPVQDRLNVRLATGAPAALRLTLCVVTGQEMAVLYEGRVQGGDMLQVARPAGVKAGLYLVKAVIDGEESTVKVVFN